MGPTHVSVRTDQDEAVHRHEVRLQSDDLRPSSAQVPDRAGTADLAGLLSTGLGHIGADPVPAAVLTRLQQTYGNQAVQRLLRSGATNAPLVQRVGAERRKKALEGERSRRVREGHLHQPRSARLREKLEPEDAESAIKTPEVGPNGEKLWNGDRRRMHWQGDVYDSVLRNATSRPYAGNALYDEYQCTKCKGYFLRQRDRLELGLAKHPCITIDHKLDWNNWVTGHVSPQSFQDAEGHDWSAYFLQDVLDEYNNEANLAPVCSSENSEKSGPKFLDGARPQHDVRCDKCRSEREGV